MLRSRWARKMKARVKLLERALRVVCFEGCPPGREFEQACLRRTCWKCRRDWALAEAALQAKEDDDGQ